jgi:hypothetical protein
MIDSGVAREGVATDLHPKTSAVTLGEGGLAAAALTKLRSLLMMTDEREQVHKRVTEGMTVADVLLVPILTLTTCWRGPLSALVGSVVRARVGESV